MTRDSARKKIDDGALEIDPNVAQRRATSPQTSVWVGASAGSGKTKVLTDRALRLLLPRDDGEPGTPPHKILCITFTKAGASEMVLRLSRTLSAWAVIAEENLNRELRNLLGRAAKREETLAARRLFAEVADAPDGLKITTIHSFCQSILGRFPLEAGISPHFKALEEREAEILLNQARMETLRETYDLKTGPLAGAVRAIGRVVNDEQFFDLVQDIIKERYQLRRLLKTHFGPDGLYAEICRAAGVRAGETPEKIRAAASEGGAFAASQLKGACEFLASGKAKSRKTAMARVVLDWLAKSDEERAAGFLDYCGAYLTQKGTPNGQIFTDAFCRDYSETADILLTEARRLMAVCDRMNAAKSALLTLDLMALGEAILQRFQALKRERGALDFDDLITHTLNLLKKDMAGWVLYKLDQGFDHILIDESQDTNPEQWKIIEILCEEFMSGAGARDGVTRTVFAVGDEKQSIFSFQRASPEEFRRMRGEFERKIKGAGQSWDVAPLNISFRSAKSVLRAVDSAFAPPEMREGLGLDEITHGVWRTGQEGIVELWPIIAGDTREEYDPWEPPASVQARKSGAAALAQKIAKTIRSWLDKGEILPARGRAVRPEDILILARSRNALFYQIVFELKRANIPVSGVDRMVLAEELAAQDMLALAEFALLPADDLSLACVLKSPLIGWDEEKLFKAAYGRGGKSLWDALKSGPFKPETNYLSELVHGAGELAPYEFFSRALHSPCPADARSGLRAFRERLGGDAADPLDELMNAALLFERGEPGSLRKFLRWQSAQTGDIKREMEEPRGEVRLMTVHGAKGLQAPVVILPDTVRGSRHKGSRILWPDKSGLPAPFWAPLEENECEAFARAKDVIRRRQEEESRRLLYVAMTRAEDRLYVCGCREKNEPRPDSWHFAVRAGLKALGDCEEMEDGTLRLRNPQTREADRADGKANAEASDVAFPDWLLKPPAQEPSPPKPLIPSRPTETDAAVLSPLENEDARRFRRGSLTHKLLQFLPGAPANEREAAARDFARAYGDGLPEEIQDEIVAETLKVLDHPSFGAIFGPGSQAEVPVTGLIGDRIISGQMDRLLVTDREIWIIDYKTNRPPPKDQKDVPAIYIRQMEAYAAALKAIYPGRKVRCALLWTDGPYLMELDV